jgi:hypothetical protein
MENQHYAFGMALTVAVATSLFYFRQKTGLEIKNTARNDWKKDQIESLKSKDSHLLGVLQIFSADSSR